MKICPQCQTAYTDDNLQFCLQDGARLTAQSDSQDFGETETVVSPKYTPDKTLVSPGFSTNKVNVDWQQTGNPGSNNFNIPFSDQQPPKSKTGLTVALTILVTLLLVGGGIAGYYFYRRSQKTETAQNINNNSVQVNANSSNKKTNANAANANADWNKTTPSPTATPTPQPTLDPQEKKEVETGVKTVIEDWKDSTENLDLDSHISSYADTVDYYNAGKVSSDKVRADREKAFSTYDNLKVNIDNVKITPDATGKKAVVVFDKEWNFYNDEKSNSGKVQQQLTFEKINGSWLITGEKDLKVYYVEK